MGEWRRMTLWPTFCSGSQLMVHVAVTVCDLSSVVASLSPSHGTTTRSHSSLSYTSYNEGSCDEESSSPEAEWFVVLRPQKYSISPRLTGQAPRTLRGSGEILRLLRTALLHVASTYSPCAPLPQTTPTPHLEKQTSISFQKVKVSTTI
jgi:hypothetical protein